ncbi:MAG: hypothetical protein ACI9TY_001034 [Alphaproteobacteria bacterium]|jgi:hypothetical protein
MTNFKQLQRAREELTQNRESLANKARESVHGYKVLKSRPRTFSDGIVDDIKNRFLNYRNESEYKADNFVSGFLASERKFDFSKLDKNLSVQEKGEEKGEEKVSITFIEDPSVEEREILRI